MPTEKLFYTDSHLRSFDATVLSCDPSGESLYAVVLDKTAFYPEGGGQPADHGTIGGQPVLDVREKNGTIFHMISGPLEPGKSLRGEIDFQRRFSHMQNHSGEHIVSGIIRKLFGFDNIGFHMGENYVTIDFNGKIPGNALREIELAANGAVYKNLPVTVNFPDAQALREIDYRSKRELSGEVRIVVIEGCDACACCGTHVKNTGEIGIIKLLSAQKYKGGTRINMLCGGMALADYAEKSQIIAEISALLSAKQYETAKAVSALLDENNALKSRIYGLTETLFSIRTEAAEPDKAVIVFESGLSADELRRFCLLLSEKTGSAYVFSGNDKEGYKYALSCKDGRARELSASLNSRFGGKGGGNKFLAQGGTGGIRSELEEIFRSFD